MGFMGLYPDRNMHSSTFNKFGRKLQMPKFDLAHCKFKTKTPVSVYIFKSFIIFVKILFLHAFLETLVSTKNCPNSCLLGVYFISIGKWGLNSLESSLITLSLVGTWI